MKRALSVLLLALLVGFSPADADAKACKNGATAKVYVPSYGYQNFVCVNHTIKATAYKLLFYTGNSNLLMKNSGTNYTTAKFDAARGRCGAGRKYRTYRYVASWNASNLVIRTTGSQQDKCVTTSGASYNIGPAIFKSTGTTQIAENTAPTLTSSAATVYIRQGTTRACAAKLTASDADGDAAIPYKVSGPAWATINRANGCVSLAPGTGVAPGTYTLNARAWDGAYASAMRSIKIIVTPMNRPPTLAPIPNQAVAQNTVLTVQAKASDPDGDPLTYSMAGGGTWATISKTGLIRLAPTFATPTGRYTLTVTVRDGRGGTASRSFVVTVTPGNHPPTLAPIPNQTVAQNASLTVQAKASDPDGDPLTYSIVGGGTWATISKTGLIRLAPTFAIPTGRYTLTVTVRDGRGGTASRSFFVTVTPGNHPPTISPIPNQTVAEGATKTVAVKATDPDGDKLTYVIIRNPPFVSINQTTGVITLKPGYTDAGVYGPITVRAADPGGLFAQTSFKVTVTNTNRAPVISPIPNQTMAEGTTKTVAVKATDPDGNAITYAVSGARFATIDPKTGLITLKPGYADAGAYTIKVTATDNGTPARSSSRTFTLTVTNTNRPPVISPIPAQTVVEGATITVAVKATDPDGNAITYSVASAPAASFITIDPTKGIMNIAPSFASAGKYTVTVTATDNGSPNLSSSKSFVLTVKNVNRPPTLPAIPNQTVKEGTLKVFLTKATDPDGDKLTYTLSGNPAFVRVNATGKISINPGYNDAGVYKGITLKVADSWGAFVSRTFSVTVVNVNRRPVIGVIPSQTVIEGNTKTVAVSAFDPDGDKLTYSISSIPTATFATINPTTGKITLTPGFNDAGTYKVTVTVRDNGRPALSASRTFTLTVTNTNRPPTIRPIPAQTVAEGATRAITVKATDPDGDAITYAVSGATFATIDPNTGVITLKPGYSDAGTYTIKVTATDNGKPARSASRTFTLTVTNTNRAPIISAIASQKVAEGATKTVKVTATDPDGDAITYAVYGARFATINPNTGVITLKPGYADAGTYTIKVTATDNGKPARSASRNFILTVTNTNRPPTISPIPNQTVAEGATKTVAVKATDPDGNAITYAVSGARFATIDPKTGLITLKPGYADAGAYTIKVTATDNGKPALSASRTFTLTVTNTNRPPTIRPIVRQTMAELEIRNIKVAATDPDGDPLNYVLVTAPAFVSISSSGVIMAKPGIFDAGTYMVTVKVTDPGGLSAQTSFTLDVTDVNQPPVAQPIPDQTVKEGTTATVQMVATDPDKGILTYSLVNPPSFVTIDPRTGLITMSPGYSHAGRFTITARATDQGGLFAEVKFVLTVVNVNRPPTIKKINDVVMDENTTLDVVPVAFDPDGDPMTFSMTSTPAAAFASINPKNGTIHFAPGYTDAGVYSITVKVTDSGGLSASTTFKLTVRNVSRPPQIKWPGNFIVKENTSNSVNVSATDPDGDKFVFYLDPKTPKWITISGNTLTMAPGYSAVSHPNKTKQITVTLYAKDTYGAIGSTTFAVVAGDVNRPPTIDPVPTVYAKENGTRTVALKGHDPDGDKLTYTKTSGPAWAKISGANVVLKPPAGAVGTYNVTVKASDGFGGTYSLTFKVIVTRAQSAVAVAATVGRVFLEPFEITRNTKYIDAPGTSFPADMYCQPTGKEICAPGARKVDICTHEVNGTCDAWTTMCDKIDAEYRCVGNKNKFDISAEIQATKNVLNARKPGNPQYRVTTPYQQKKVTTTVLSKTVAKCQYNGSPYMSKKERIREYALNKVKTGTITLTRTYTLGLTNNTRQTFKSDLTSASGVPIATQNIIKHGKYCNPGTFEDPLTSSKKSGVYAYLGWVLGSSWHREYVARVCENVGMPIRINLYDRMDQRLLSRWLDPPTGSCDAGIPGAYRGLASKTLLLDPATASNNITDFGVYNSGACYPGYIRIQTTNTCTNPWNTDCTLNAKFYVKQQVRKTVNGRTVYVPDWVLKNRATFTYKANHMTALPSDIKAAIDAAIGVLKNKKPGLYACTASLDPFKMSATQLAAFNDTPYAKLNIGITCKEDVPTYRYDVKLVSDSFPKPPASCRIDPGNPAPAKPPVGTIEMMDPNNKLVYGCFSAANYLTACQNFYDGACHDKVPHVYCSKEDFFYQCAGATLTLTNPGTCPLVCETDLPTYLDQLSRGKITLPFTTANNCTVKSATCNSWNRIMDPLGQTRIRTYGVKRVATGTKDVVRTLIDTLTNKTGSAFTSNVRLGATSIATGSYSATGASPTKTDILNAIAADMKKLAGMGYKSCSSSLNATTLTAAMVSGFASAGASLTSKITCVKTVTTYKDVVSLAKDSYPNPPAKCKIDLATTTPPIKLSPGQIEVADAANPLIFGCNAGRGYVPLCMNFYDGKCHDLMQHVYCTQENIEYVCDSGVATCADLTVGVEVVEKATSTTKKNTPAQVPTIEMDAFDRSTDPNLQPLLKQIGTNPGPTPNRTTISLPIGDASSTQYPVHESPPDLAPDPANPNALVDKKKPGSVGTKEFVEAISKFAIAAGALSSIEGRGGTNDARKISTADFLLQNVFAGDYKSCGRDIILNYCKMKPDINTQVCHDLGEYCVQDLFGWCFNWERDFCCFGSKFNKSVSVQVHNQLGIGWGPQGNRNCAGITVDDLKRVDWSKIDMSALKEELTGDIGVNLGKVRDAIKSQMGNIAKQFGKDFVSGSKSKWDSATASKMFKGIGPDVSGVDGSGNPLNKYLSDQGITRDMTPNPPIQEQSNPTLSTLPYGQFK